MKYLASRKLWNLQTWKYQTQTLELFHLFASNSEIGIWVAPSIEISLDSNTQTVGNRRIYFQSRCCFKTTLRYPAGLSLGSRRKHKQAHAICKSIKLEVSWKPPYYNGLGHARTNPYIAQVHPAHWKKLFFQSDLESRNSHCLESLEHGDILSSTSLQQSVFS